jgi:Coenzyme PQQ synthesis protein D (PqqD)
MSAAMDSLVSPETNPLFSPFLTGQRVRSITPAEVNMPSTDEAVWMISPDVRATHSEDGAVLLDINQGLCYSLNVVGSQIWLTIESSPGIRLEGIVDALQTHFQVPREQLRTDTAEYLSNLLQKGLLHCNGAAASVKAATRNK